MVFLLLWHVLATPPDSLLSEMFEINYHVSGTLNLVAQVNECAVSNVLSYILQSKIIMYDATHYAIIGKLDTRYRHYQFLIA